MDLYIGAIVAHVVGTALGVGAVTLNDVLFMRVLGSRARGVAE